VSNWIALKSSDIVPPTLTQSFDLGVSAYQTYLEAVQATIALSKLAQSALNPDTPSILKELVQAIVDVVEGVLQTGKVHVLFVPMAKTYPGVTKSGLPSTLGDMAEFFGVTKEAIAQRASPNAASAYSSAISRRKGNAGFLQTFVESLIDELDPNRPQYLQENDAVAMQVILVGANTFSAAVNAAAGLTRIFQPKGDKDLASRQLPIPQDLKAKVIGVPSDTRIGVRLDWKTPPAKFSSKFFPGSYTRAKRVAVIRSTDPRVRSKRSVLDLFTTQTLTEGLESTDSDKFHKVIGIASGMTTTWIDNEELDATKTYYYTLAWELEVAEDGVINVLPFDKLSSVVKTQARKTTATEAGNPPNWQSEEAPLDAIPGLAQQSKVLLERLKAQTTRANGPKALLSSALDTLTKNLERQAKQVEDLANQMALFTTAISVPLPQIYTTSITGVGGNALLVAELASRLFDPEDDNRPPFDGAQYVIGVCVVAGGPRIPDLSAVTDLLSDLFDDPKATNPLADALADLEAVVANEEGRVFGPDMQPYPYNPDGTVETPDGPVDPADIDPDTGKPVIPSLPALAADGTPVATMDPANPDAGDTDAASCFPDPCSS